MNKHASRIGYWTLGSIAGIAIVLAALAVPGCGGGNEDLTCNASSCACAPGGTCDFSSNECGPDSCSLSCGEDNVCTGSCGESCSIGCGGMSTCTVTVGPSGSVSCADGSTCHVTCTGECSVSCSGGAACDLECPGDAQPQSIAGGGQC